MNFFGQRALALPLHLTAVLCLLFAATPPGLALDEIFNEYSSPQGLAMGNALTADASGYLANYYNPAGLAKGHKKRWEVILVDAEILGSLTAIGRVATAKGIGISQLMGPMAFNAGQYTYFNLASVPSMSTRNFGASFLADYQYAGLSDGTKIDMNSHLDLGPTVGVATNMLGNLFKIGIAAKTLLRDELKGTFPISGLATESAIASSVHEGIGLGADLGMMFTLPYRALPTLGVVWKDMFDTRFLPVSLLNPSASGAPDSIAQSFNTAFSIHPIVGRRLQATLAFEIRHWERTDLPLQKKIHIGLQLEKNRRFFVWLGANQLLLTGGVALRLPGGNLEIGTYAVDVGAGTQIQQDRRYSFRYTVSF